MRELIRDSLKQILHDAMLMPKNVQQNNAQNAVLFEAINLVIHLDTEHELMRQISSKLGKFIQSRETNVRYLGLVAMTHFSARAETLDPIKKHQNIILGSLRDRDISVRRKGLDLLYSMCDLTNSQPIVNELLKYLQNADYAIREEMVLKIAILTEKYATDIQWYVDITLKLIAMAGDHVSDEVWQRVIQVVSNNEGLQDYAASSILDFLRHEHCHETIVRIGSYLLGEFGHLIADRPDCSPIEQFMVLQSKLPSCSIGTRAMILSCFVKFVNLFPEIKPQLLEVFRAYTHSLDPELQQRACEYLALIMLPTDDLLRTVCDEMPAFPERASVLLSRLHSKQVSTSDRRTWFLGGKDANTDPKELLVAQRTGMKGPLSIANGPSAPPTPTVKDNPMSLHSNGNKDLEGIDMNIELNGAAKTPKTPNFASAAHLSPGWEPGYKRLLFADEGVLYQDTQLQVGLRSEYRGPMGCLILYFKNRTSSTIGSFTTTFDTASPDVLGINTKNFPDTNVAPDAQVQQTVMFEAKNVFPDPPTVRISYLAGSLQAITLQLPVVAHKFMEPAKLSAEDFFKRWRQVGGKPREAQRVFGLASKNRTMDPMFTNRTVESFNWGILSGVDPNSKNVVGASVMHTGLSGKFGCLLRLEPNYDTKVCSPFSVSCTSNNVVPRCTGSQSELRTRRYRRFF